MLLTPPSFLTKKKKLKDSISITSDDIVANSLSCFSKINQTFEFPCERIYEHTDIDYANLDITDKYTFR